MTFIKGIASIGAAMLIGLSAQSAQAGYVVDLTQVGSDVVASGSGTIDLTDLSFDLSDTPGADLLPSGGIMLVGPVSAPVDDYLGIAGPPNFGSGSEEVPNSGSGDLVGIFGAAGRLNVPEGYVSGSALSSTSTYSGQTFSSLGATPGTYKWTWGTGAHADSFTLKIGAAAIPEPSTWAMMLLGFAGLGFMGYRSPGRRRRTAGNA